MIVNIPTKIDFETVAKENLTQAFNLLYKVYEDYSYYDDEIIKEEVPINDIWKHHNGTLRTALILLHQAIEGLMKAGICETSPLLLIDKPRKDWPSLPQSENKDFDNLYTIGGEALLSTFCAVNSKIDINSNLINFIEEIRKKRNQVIHGFNKSNVTTKYIIENILKIFTIWFGKDNWLKELKIHLIESPLFGYFDYDFESANSYKYLDFVLFILGKNKLSKYVSFDIKGREYFCPKCKSDIDGDYGELISKWAFLNPNIPNSTNLSCTNCQENFEVKRKKCIEANCKGNVVFYDEENSGDTTCLTCFSSQDTEKYSS